MEENYLYPGDGLRVVSEGMNYREYLLSDILSLHGLSIRYIRPLFARKKMEIRTSADLSIIRASGCYVVLVILDNGKHIALAPLNYHHNLSNVEYNQSRRMLGYHSYSDVVVRYYVNNGGSVFRPVWSSLVDTDGSRDKSIGPEIVSAFCLLDGDLITDYTVSDGIADVSNDVLDIDKYYF